MKREKTLMFRVVKKYDSGEPEILYSERDEVNAKKKFDEVVSECVRKDVYGKYTPKEIEFGIFNEYGYVFPKKVAQYAITRVLAALNDQEQRYFYAKNQKGEHYSVYIEKMWTIDEV